MPTMTNRFLTKSEYTRKIDTIFIGLILQMLLFEISPAALKFLSEVLCALGLSSNPLFFNIQSIFSIILYCVSFLLPAFFISKNISENVEEGYIYNNVSEQENGNSDISVFVTIKAVFPKNFLLVLIASLGCISCASYFTGTLIEFVENLGITFVAYAPEIPNDAAGLILLFISSVAVPSFVEEILFRKAILGSLMPYGKWVAILVSAASFSLMHRNPPQFLFTFIGGIFLGVLTVKCSSVLPAIILHFSNNALSLVYMLIEKYAGEEIYNAVVPTFEIILNIVGALCLVILISKKYFNLDDKQNKPNFSPMLNSIRVLSVFYVLFCLYLSTYWVKFI